MHIPILREGMCVLRDVHFFPTKPHPPLNQLKANVSLCAVEFLLSFILGFIPGCCVFFVVFFRHKDSQLDCLGKAKDMRIAQNARKIRSLV